MRLCKLNVNDFTVCIDKLFLLRIETDCFLNAILIYFNGINVTTIEHCKRIKYKCSNEYRRIIVVDYI
jgi:hypothetical protein